MCAHGHGGVHGGVKGCEPVEVVVKGGGGGVPDGGDGHDGPIERRGIDVGGGQAGDTRLRMADAVLGARRGGAVDACLLDQSDVVVALHVDGPDGVAIPEDGECAHMGSVKRGGVKRRGGVAGPRWRGGRWSRSTCRCRATRRVASRLGQG
jgi:hypothetical protein